MNNKSIDRNELHKVIWKAATDFVHGGKVAAWDFKEYFLGVMFYRFISENIENYVNKIQHEAGIKNFKYRDLADEDAEYGKSQILEEKGLFIKPSELFCNIRKNAENDENLNVTLFNTFNNIESSAQGTNSEADVKGLFASIDVNSNKLGETVPERNENLKKLLDVIGDLPLGDYQSNTIDVFGDAYEYLMNMYAGTAGKKGGEFFTPQEVGELLAKIVIGDKSTVNKVYDPCCGSGGLLLKFSKILGQQNVRNGFYGQEINLTTYNLARINMFLHDINYNKFNLAREDTLLHPAHWDDEPFDAIVSNPPYSIGWGGKNNPLYINDDRFAPAGILAPESKADLAFTMHMLSWLSPKGTAAIVEFPGALSRENFVGEIGIRKYLVLGNYVDTVIQLPTDMFFGTTTGTCILVLKKNKTDNNILFIDASNEFVPNPDKMKNATNKNKLSDENIKNILELIHKRENIDKKSKVVSVEEIELNNYSLSVTKYLKIENDKDASNKSLDDIDFDVLEDNINKNRIALNNFINENMDLSIANSNCEYIKLEEILKYEQPGKYQVSSTNYNDKYEIPVLTAGQTFILGYTNETDGIYKATLDNPVVIFDDFTTSSHWVDFNFKVKSSAMKMLTLIDEEKYNFKYVYYCMKNIKYVPGEHARQWIKTYSQFEIPVPDKKTQDKIVNFLDSFDKLEAELEAELEARRTQREFWRAQLLNMEDENE